MRALVSRISAAAGFIDANTYVLNSLETLLRRIKGSTNLKELSSVLDEVSHGIFRAFDAYIKWMIDNYDPFKFAVKRNDCRPTPEGFLRFACNSKTGHIVLASTRHPHDSPNDRLTKLLNDTRQGGRVGHFVMSGVGLSQCSREDFMDRHGYAVDALIDGFSKMPEFEDFCQSPKPFAMSFDANPPIDWMFVALKMRGCSFFDLMGRLKTTRTPGMTNRAVRIFKLLSVFFHTDSERFVRQLGTVPIPPMMLQTFACHPNYPHQLANVTDLFEFVDRLQPAHLAVELLPNEDMRALAEIEAIIQSVKVKPTECPVCCETFGQKRISVPGQKQPLEIGARCCSASGRSDSVVKHKKQPCVPGKKVCQSCIADQSKSGMAGANQCAFCKEQMGPLPGSLAMHPFAQSLERIQHRLRMIKKKTDDSAKLTAFVASCHSQCSVLYPDYVMAKFRSLDRSLLTGDSSNQRKIMEISARVNKLSDDLKTLEVQERGLEEVPDSEGEDETASASASSSASASASASRKRPRGGARNKTKRHQRKQQQQRHRNRNHAKSKRKSTK
jgi:hypothetical protein